LLFIFIFKKIRNTQNFVKIDFHFFFLPKSNFKINKTQVINKTLYTDFTNKNRFLNMAIMKKINKIIDSSIGDFCQQIALKYDLNKLELMEMWHQSNSINKKKGTKKRSPYQNYAAYLRPLLIEKNPDITFGEISGETSRRWKDFTAEQKAQYKATQGATEEIDLELKENPHDSNDAKPKAKQAKKTKKESKEANSLESKKLPELKEMCKEHGLATTGKKQELIDRLKNREKQLSPVVANSDTESMMDNDSDNDSENIVEDKQSERDEPEDLEQQEETENANGISPISMTDLVSLKELDDDASHNDTDDEDETQQQQPVQVNYSDMTLAQIKDLCKQRGVSSKGNKTELIHRLTA